MSRISQELLSQPECWRIAANRVTDAGELLPAPGARVALAGCGTSLYVAQAMATWRESQGDGVSDAFAASEMPLDRVYDLVIVVSRSGTTTEVRELVDVLKPTSRVLAITASADTPVAQAASESLSLPFADEQSIVQTRFATSVCALWRAHLGHDVAGLARDAEAALAQNPPVRLGEYRQFVFLGRGAGAALASEAALKFREAALSWSEAYPTMEFRHGPISVIDEQTLVWAVGEMETGLAQQLRATGATVHESAGDPMVDLVRAHQAAVALAGIKGLDPDHPRRLTRSVILT